MSPKRHLFFLKILAVSFCTAALLVCCGKKSDEADLSKRDIIDDVALDGRKKLSKKEQEKLKKLGTLPYLAGSKPVPAQTGVTVYDENLSYSGVNLYTSGHGCEAILMDMQGNFLHKWKYSSKQIEEAKSEQMYWRHAFLFENGDLIVIIPERGLLKIDKDSNKIWFYKARAHHDLDIAEDGRIFVLTRENADRPDIWEHTLILEDFVTILDKHGNELDKISILECFENSKFKHLLQYINQRDIFHTNTLEILDGSLGRKIPAFKKGNILICLHRTSTIAVLNPEERKIVWALSHMFFLPHHPTVLPNGNILLFVNCGFEYESQMRSQLLELNPLTQEIKWTYRHKDFFSKTGASADRLTNGNTLITESNSGRAFEITKEGKIVWQYLNPHVVKDDRETYIARIYTLQRYPADFPKFFENPPPKLP
jgi:hypothetical protein